jgi:hypothetical protein
MDSLEVTGLDGTRIVARPGELAAALTPGNSRCAGLT